MAVFRSYESAICRWMQIDPKYTYSQSAFSGFGNNPIVFIDILGDTTNYYDTESGEHHETLYGSQGYNDRTISRKDYNRLMQEKYLFNNVTIGSYNIYSIDPNKTFDDFLDTNGMEAFLNNSENAETSQIYLNSDIGKLARIGFAEFRGAQTMDDVLIPGQYTSLQQGDPNKVFFDHPHSQASNNVLNQGAWTRSVSAALRVGNGNSGITQGATHYFSPRSMRPRGSVPNWADPKKEINIDGIRKSHMRIFKGIR